MKKYYPSKSSLNLIKILGFSLVLALVISAIIFLSNYKTLMWISIFILIIAYFLVFLVYFPLFFKKVSYLITDTQIIKISGFFINTKTVIRISSIQYISSLELPLSKFFVTNIIIFKALGSSLVFYFLSKDDSKEIYSELSIKIKSQEKE